MEKKLTKDEVLSVLEENWQAQIAGYYNHDRTDEERKIRNEIIREYHDLIAIFKAKFESDTTKQG